MDKIKVAIIGVGNCAKSLIEGIHFYSQNPQETVGLIHPTVGGYSISDIEIVEAFDVDERKVGKLLHEAVTMEPNRTMIISEISPSKIIVKRGPTLDSIIDENRKYFIHESNKPSVDVAATLKQSGAEVVLNYLPTGSDEAAFAYAQAALDAGCSFINCMPTKLGRDEKWIAKFSQKGLVLLGDDIKSQLGATIVNRSILELFKRRGFRVTQSDQTNFGGNADHHNLHYRPDAKEECKETSLGSVLSKEDVKPNARMIYTEKNYDHKRASLFVMGEMFGKVPASVQVILDDEDSPNSGGIVVDAIRAVKVLIDKNVVDRAAEISASIMKAPYKQMSEEDSYGVFSEITN
ncbi:MAG: inositol-3-phosphate synthase [Candidatus Taylorbacteria bacterium]|nr:inositol-3-phosphate synthase [Candidatus Taylorbacteria bacterium]